MSIETYIDKRASEILGFYVYCLIDPLTRDVFYIGKGQGGRADSHQFEKAEKKKNQLLRKIEKSGKQVEKIIIAFGLKEEEAFKIESILITMLMSKKEKYQNINLLNIQGGHHLKNIFLSLDEINADYGSKPLDSTEIKHDVLCINLNKTFNQLDNLLGDERKQRLYHITRGSWIRLNKSKAEKHDLVFAEYNGIVRAIYKPTKWVYDIEDTDFIKQSDSNNPKLCFVGEDVTEDYPEYLYLNLQKKPRTTSRFKYLSKSN